jgi:hypothetical protein
MRARADTAPHPPSRPTPNPSAPGRPVPIRRSGRSGPRGHCPPAATTPHFEIPDPQAPASGGDQHRPNTASPPRRVDIESAELAIARHIWIPRRRCRGESADRPIVDRDHRRRLTHIITREAIPLRSVLRARSIQIRIWKQPAIARLPGPHMHASHRQGILRLGWTKKHTLSLAQHSTPPEFGPAHLSYRPKPLFAYTPARYSSPYHPGLRTR